MLLFGLRHSPVGGNKHLAGTIIRAELYDRALTPEEVAASASVLSNFISDEEIERRLDSDATPKRKAIKRSIEELLVKSAAAAPATRVCAATPRPADSTYLLDRGNPAQKGKLL